MHEDPEPTEEERDQPPERIEEEDSMSAPGHDTPGLPEDTRGSDA